MKDYLRRNFPDCPNKKREHSDSRENSPEALENIRQKNTRLHRRYDRIKEGQSTICTTDLRTGFRVRYDTQNQECHITDIDHNAINVSTTGQIPDNPTQYVAIHDQIAKSVTIYDTQGGGVKQIAHIENIDEYHTSSPIFEEIHTPHFFSELLTNNSLSFDLLICQTMEERAYQLQPTELPQQIGGYHRQNVSGTGMDCMIRAVLVSGGHTPDHPQFKDTVTDIRTSLVQAGLTRRNRMLNLGDESGLGAIALMRSIQIGDQPLLDPRRGIDVYTLDPQTGQERVTHAVEGEAGQQPYAIFLDDSIPGTEHFHALVPENTSTSHEREDQQEQTPNLSSEATTNTIYIQSPGGTQWAYQLRKKGEAKEFLKRTGMQSRPSSDQIKEEQVKNLAQGRSKKAGKGTRKWKCLDEQVIEKMNRFLNITNQRSRERYDGIKEDKEAYEKYLDEQKKRSRKRHNGIKEDPEAYERYLDEHKKRNKKWYDSIKEDPEAYERYLDEQKKKSKERYDSIKEDQEAYEKYIDEQKKRNKKRLDSIKDPEKCKQYYDRKYQRQESQYTRAQFILNKQLKKESNGPLQQAEIRRKQEELETKWKTFQVQHQTDLKKLEDLLQTQGHLQQGLESYCPSPQHEGTDQIPHHIHNQIAGLENRIQAYFEENRETLDLNDLLDSIFEDDSPSPWPSAT